MATVLPERHMTNTYKSKRRYQHLHGTKARARATACTLSQSGCGTTCAASCTCPVVGHASHKNPSGNTPEHQLERCLVRHMSNRGACFAQKPIRKHAGAPTRALPRSTHVQAWSMLRTKTIEETRRSADSIAASFDTCPSVVHASREPCPPSPPLFNVAWAIACVCVCVRLERLTAQGTLPPLPPSSMLCGVAFLVPSAPTCLTHATTKGAKGTACTQTQH